MSQNSRGLTDALRSPIKSRDAETVAEIIGFNQRSGGSSQLRKIMEALEGIKSTSPLKKGLGKVVLGKNQKLAEAAKRGSGIVVRRH